MGGGIIIETELNLYINLEKNSWFSNTESYQSLAVCSSRDKHDDTCHCWILYAKTIGWACFKNQNNLMWFHYLCFIDEKIETHKLSNLSKATKNTNMLRF